MRVRNPTSQNMLIVSVITAVIVGCIVSQMGHLPIPPVFSGEAKSRDIPLSALTLQPIDVPFSIGPSATSDLDKDLVSNADENLRVTYNSVVHTVIRFDGDNRANWEFKHSLQRSPLFTVGLYGTPPPLVEPRYISPYADDWLILCTDKYCQSMSRYGEIVSIVLVPIHAQGRGLTLMQFEQLIEACDKRIGKQTS
jgi:hypothetical protein